MKNATIATGLIAVLMITTALAFKLTHLPGAGTLLMCTGLFLSLYYTMYALDRLNEKNRNITSAIKVTTAICIICIELGVTFRLNYWPYANILLEAGLFGFSLVLVPQLCIQKMREFNTDVPGNLAGALALSCFGLGALFKLENWPGAAVLLTLVPVFLSFYFTRYLLDKTIEVETKHRYLRSAFMVIVAGSIISLYFMKSIEIHDAQNVTVNEQPIQITAAR